MAPHHKSHDTTPHDTTTTACTSHHTHTLITLTNGLFTDRASETIWTRALWGAKHCDTTCAGSSIKTRTDVCNERMGICAEA